MNLMGDYAAANHAVIHARLARHLGADVLAGVENHHNFAWKERHGEREVIVHRKGATPAGAGVLGVIPGSMATPGFVVRGRGLGREPRVGEPRRGPRDEPHGRAAALHLEAGAAAAGAGRRAAARRPASTRTRSSTRTSTP